MDITVFICPSCGAKLTSQNNSNMFICEFCDSTVIRAKSSPQQDFASNTDALLTRAFLFLEESEFDKAHQYFENILDLNPHCSQAYIGKLLSRLRLHTIQDLVHAPMLLTAYDDYNKAVRFASQEELETYEQLNAAVLQQYQTEKLQREQEIVEWERYISEAEQYLAAHKNDYRKLRRRKAIWLVLFILAVCSVLFWTVGTIAVFPFIIFDLPCIAWMIFVIIKLKKASALSAEYLKMEHSLTQAKVTLSYRQNDLNSWNQSKTMH